MLQLIRFGLCFDILVLVLGNTNTDSGYCESKIGPVCGEDGFVYANSCIAYYQNVTEQTYQSCFSGIELNFADDQRFESQLMIKGFKYLGRILSQGQQKQLQFIEQKNKSDTSGGKLQGSVFITSEGHVYKADENQDLWKKVSNYQELSINKQSSTKFRKLLQVDFESSILKGQDTRKLVDVTQTTQFPFSAFGSFGNEKCTGTLIDKHHVLTAAHCVYENGVQKGGLEFSAGQSGNVKPFGTVQWFGVQVPDEWIRSSDPAYDYALVYLLQDIGDQTGYFQYGSDCDNEIYNLNLDGYDFEQNPDGSLLHSYCAGVRISCASREFTHECDASLTQQGSVLWLYIKGGNLNGDDLFSIRGVHSRVDNSGQFNLGMALTPQVVQTIQQWVLQN